ncbi:alpha/beta fold hydrolase [Pseudoalteromonas sp. A757]|uniref:S9 family peptidase n=2 Tax=unclassified Pseudoalteromonas TaxID=194690 RepID=UPI000FFE610E|nr:alpha/beta fold hydrolase [Pseudoalteromonas sp. A757]RXE87891.1 S9 family peptidase [Pseudoalteromonas sp. A757]
MKYNLIKVKTTIISSLVLAGLSLSGCQVGSFTQKTTHTVAQTQTQLIALKDLFSEQTMESVSLSPDGEWIAFLQPHNGANNIHLVRKGGNLSDAKPITYLTDSVDNFVWSYHTNEIIFSKDHEGNENKQIFTLQFNPNNLKNSIRIKNLTNKEDVNYILAKQLHDNSNKLAVFANLLQSDTYSLYQLDTKTQTMTLIDPNELKFSKAILNRAGEIMVGVVLNNDSSMTLYKKEEQSWQQVLRTQPGEQVEVIGYNESKHTAVLSGSIQGRDKQELIELDLGTNILHTLHSDPLNNSDLYHVILQDDGQPLIAAYYDSRLRNYPLTESAASILSRITSHFGTDADIHVEQIEGKTGHWHITTKYANKPDEQFVFNPNTDQLIGLLNSEPSFDPELLGTRQSINYTATDGTKIQAYLTLPKYANTTLPTIVLPHGGPWVRDKWEFSSGYFVPIAHYFANRGYAVLQPNFRGSTGFGKHFTSAGNKQWGIGSMQQDITDGVHYLIAQGITDKNRVGIMGASYGGFAALAGATFTPDLYKAVISYVGPSDLNVFMASFPEAYRPYLGNFYAAIGDPAIEADRKDMAARSPINFIDNIKAPIMLIQGANDPRVPQEQSELIAKALFNAQLPVEYILAKNEGHGFIQHNNKLASIIAMERFFAIHLGGTKSDSDDPDLANHLATLTVDVSTL